MGKRIALHRILLRDWPSAGCVVFAAMCLSLILGSAVYGWIWKDAECLRFAFCFATLIVSPICVGWGLIVALRIRLIARLLAHGPRVSGRIVSLGMNSEDIEHAVVAYTYKDQSFSTIVTTESFWPGFSPQAGDEVELLVDPDRPKRAFFAKMFVGANGAR